MQELVSDLLPQFLHCSTSDVPRQIDDALARLGSFVGADRAYVFAFEPGERMSNTHEWCAHGIQPEIESLQDLPRGVVHYWLEPLARGEPVYVPDVAALPDDRERERDILSRQGIRSLLVVPMLKSGELSGFVGFDAVCSHRTFSEGEVNLLTLVADLICAGLVREETEQKMAKAQARLERQEERFRIIADTVSDVLWDYDMEEQKVWVTPEWPTKIGLNVEGEHFGFLSWRDYVHPDDLPRVLASLRDAIRSGSDRWEYEYRGLGSDGVVIDVEVKGSILRRGDGWAVRILGNLRNITEENRRRDGFTRSRALEAVGQMTGGIAHDFNNLLAIIQGNAELLEMSDLDEEDAESVALISKAAQSSAQLTARLLSFAGQNRLNLARVDLHDVVTELVPLLRSGLTEAVDLEIDIAPGAFAIIVDQAALEQAIINLAVNSRDAMHSGGTVRIMCEPHRVLKNDGRSANDLTPGDYVCIKVIDDGKGMESDVLAKALEPFFTTKDVGKGTGLGLSMVFGFARQSGGALAIESTLGEGTVASLYLPLSEPPPAPSEGARPDAVQSLPASGRILVAEDQSDVRKHVVKVLRQAGFDVCCAPNAHQALTRLTNGERFDVLFTDVLMPGGMNGVQLAEAAAKIDPEMDVLFTSGFPADAFDQIGIDPARTLHLLKKPYRASELISTLGELLRNRPEAASETQANR